MKKTIAIILLILGGAAGIALLTLLTMLVYVIAAMMIPVGGEWALYTITACFVLLTGYPVNHLREFYKKKYGVCAPVFLACLCAPSVIASVIVRATYSPVETEPPSADTAALRLTFWVLVAAVFTVGVVWRAIYAAIVKRRDRA